jgi:hypothetical protein
MQTETTNETAAPVVTTTDASTKPARKPRPTSAGSRPASSAATSEPNPATNAKPAAARAKPAKPAKAKPDARAELTAADREAARRFYDGQSLAVHSTTPRKRGDYAARVLQPVQCASSPSVRDESGLALILSRADKAGAFDPCAGSGLDLGICSRLASLGLIAFEARTDVFSLTPAGLSRARAVVKRFKAA